MTGDWRRLSEKLRRAVEFGSFDDQIACCQFAPQLLGADVPANRSAIQAIAASALSRAANR